jgi:hypothetical protein
MQKYLRKAAEVLNRESFCTAEEPADRSRVKNAKADISLKD